MTLDNTYGLIVKKYTRNQDLLRRYYWAIYTGEGSPQWKNDIERFKVNVHQPDVDIVLQDKVFLSRRRAVRLAQRELKRYLVVPKPTQSQWHYGHDGLKRFRKLEKDTSKEPTN